MLEDRTLDVKIAGDHSANNDSTVIIIRKSSLAPETSVNLACFLWESMVSIPDDAL